MVNFFLVNNNAIRLILIFILVPIIDLSLLIELRLHIGLEFTLAIVIVTGVIGAYLARYEGFKVIHQIRQELQSSRIPAEGLIDGIIILTYGL